MAVNDLDRVLENPLYPTWVENQFVELYERYRELVATVFRIAQEKDDQIQLFKTQENIDWCVADTKLAADVLDTAPPRIAERLEAVGRTREFHLR